MKRMRGVSFFTIFVLAAGLLARFSFASDRQEEAFKAMIAESENHDIIEGSYAWLLNHYFQQKEYSQLILWADKYLTAYPDGSLCAKVYFYLGETAYTRGQLDKAAANYHAALKFSNEHKLTDLIHHGLGFTYLARGDNVTAKDNIAAIKNKELGLFSQSVYYFKIKNYTLALDKMDEFLTEFKESAYLAAVYLNKADTLYELGRMNDARFVYQSLLDNFGGAADKDVLDKAYYGLGWCCLRAGDFKAAMQAFQRSLEQTDNEVVKLSSQIQIADVHHEQADYAAALDIYREILDSNPSNIYADYIQFQAGMIHLKTGRFRDAINVLSELKYNFSSSNLQPQINYYLAAAYFTQGNYARAKELLQDFIAQFPEHDLAARAYYLYGRSFFNEGDYPHSLEIFKHIIEKFGNQQIEEIVFIDMGNVYINLSLFDKAKEVWEGFLAQSPDSSYAGPVTLYLGGVYEKEGDYARAEKYYEKVISDFAGASCEPEAKFCLARLYCARGQWDKARALFDALSGGAGDFSLPARLYLAKIYVKQGKEKEALALYDELINTSGPVAAEALVDKAVVLKEMKCYDEAAFLFQKAIAGRADCDALRFSRGICLEKLARNHEAIEEYFKIIHTGGDTNDKVKAYFRIARLYEKQGDNAAAKDIYRKITGFDVEEAKIAQARLQGLGD